MTSKPLTEVPFEIAGSAGKPIRGDVRLATEGLPKGIIVFCHGLKGFKDWGGWPYLMRTLSQQGFVTIAFNLSHGGIGDVPDQFTELELFKQNTYAREREDLRCVLNAVRQGALPGISQHKSLPLCLLGHSRGGAGVLCVGSERDDVSAICTLASVSSLGKVPPELERRWRSEGVRYIENSRTKQQLPMGIPLLDEILNDRAIIETATRKLKQPLLVVHGTADEAVSFTAAEEIVSWAPNVQLLPLEGVDHVFGMKHPFALDMVKRGSALSMVIDRIVEFFQSCVT